MRISNLFLFTPCCILLIAVFLFCMGCSSYQYNDPFFGKDKLYHFTGAMIIGSGVKIAAKNNGYNKNDAPVIGTSVAFTIGMGKEFYDLTVKETFWSWKDLFWDIAGGAAGSYLMFK